MILENKFNIEDFLDLTDYSKNRLSRRKYCLQGTGTGEFFTPYSIVKRMCDKVPEDELNF